MTPHLFALHLLVSGVLPRNRLTLMNARQATYLFLRNFLGSALNRLATMNYRQAAQRCPQLFCVV